MEEETKAQLRDRLVELGVQLKTVSPLDFDEETLVDFAKIGFYGFWPVKPDSVAADDHVYTHVVYRKTGFKAIAR